MTLKILQEVTNWKVPYRQPNHVYLMSGDRAYALSRWGECEPQYLKVPLRIDRRGRKFIETKRNIWRFDLSIQVQEEPESRPSGKMWEVRGSRGDIYTVSLDSGRWSCSCPGYGFRRQCRHIDQTRANQLTA